MFAKYLDAAMKLAEYELIEDGTFFATIPGFPGVWGNGKTIEACRTDLLDALDGWLLGKIWDNDDDIPILGKLILVPRKVRLPSARSKRMQDAATTQTRTRKAS